MIKISNFGQKLLEKCQHQPRILALPESHDLRILEAAAYLLNSRAVRAVVLWSTPSKLAARVKELAIDFPLQHPELRFADQIAPDLALESLTTLSAAGSKRTHEELQRWSDTALFQSAQLLRTGTVDAVVAGALQTTADVIRAGVHGVGMAPGVTTVSGSFLMHKEDQRPFLFADCAVNVDPNPQQLNDIAHESVALWRSISVLKDETPRVAFLSFSTKGSARHVRIDTVLAAVKLFKSNHTDVLVDGELQFDAAFVPHVAQLKAPDSPIAGEANIFIFPNLDAGNIAYKVTQRLGNYEAFGPLLQGLAKPFSDLSRGSNTTDIIVAACINLARAKIG